MAENQSGHPQHGMADQGFRPFTSPLLSAPAITQPHASSSVNTASIQMPITAPLQMPIQPSHPDSASMWPTDDGYVWRPLGWQQIPGFGGRLANYECAQANCRITKLVALSSCGQIVETIVRGSHNHPLPSERWHGGGPAGFGPGSQDHELPEVSGAGPSMPRSEEGDEQLPSSSDSEEDDDGEAGAIGDVAGYASTMERNVPAPAEKITAQTKGGNSKRKRSKPSKVWEEFTAVSIGGITQSAKCNHCKKQLSGKSTGGTSHLRRHLKTCPERPAAGRVQQQRSSPHPDSSVAKNWKFDQDKSLELLTKSLVSNLCSFSMTSSTNFRQFLAGISPTYDMVSQAAIEEKFLSIFHNEKLKLKQEIALAPGGVFLTVARWGLEYKYFICVTAHFIDKEWNMIRKIITCRFMGAEDLSNHVGMFPDWQSYHNWKTWCEDDEANAKEIVEVVVQNWSLEGKLFGISLHKSLHDTTILGLQKNFTEQNCLLVRYSLLSLSCIIDSLHDLFECTKTFVKVTISEGWFRYMTCSPLRTEKYKEILSQLQVNRPSFGSQEWHFTFYLLEAALHFNKAFPNPEQIDSKSHAPKPSGKKLEATENFCDLARLIYYAIKVVSSPDATSNSHFHSICSLKIALSSSRKENINEVFDIKSMQEKFDKLWRKWYLWLCLAVILDPRYKIKLLDRSLIQAFGSDAKRYLLDVRGKLYELFFRYSFQADQRSGINDSNSDLQLDARGHGSVIIHDASQNYNEQSAHEELGELNGYLEKELIHENVPLDILKWWKDNASTYPSLARLACDILAIPRCLVSSESAFDITDERVSLFNRKLSPETVEALICTQDWIKSAGASTTPHLSTCC